MAALMAARQAANMARLSSPKMASASSLIQRRGLAGGADPHGTPKVDFWKDPMSPSKWKEEHFVLVSLTGWGVFIYGTYKLFTRGKKDKKEEKVVEAAH